jgi:hypothetical protein
VDDGMLSNTKTKFEKFLTCCWWHAFEYKKPNLKSSWHVVGDMLSNTKTKFEKFLTCCLVTCIWKSSLILTSSWLKENLSWVILANLSMKQGSLFCFVL